MEEKVPKTELDEHAETDNEASDAVEAIENEEREAPIAESEASDKLPETAKPRKSLKARLFTKKKLLIFVPLFVVIILALILIIPVTRYASLGLFWQQTYSVSVIDSQTMNPVSEAAINIDGKTVVTSNQGKASLEVAVGHREIKITKGYYASLDQKILIPIRVKGVSTYKLIATGRHVPISLVNLISNAPVNNVLIKAGNAQVRTDSSGKATIVLPADQKTVSANIVTSDYNSLPLTIQVTEQAVPANDFKLTPAGKVYFLSKLSGKIDVVKTNLDGTDRQTVLAGTGNEDDSNTVLLASRDWKYLALLTIRTAGGNQEIDLIDATNGDKVTNIDQGSATYQLVGWSNSYFVYEVNRSSVNSWDPNASSIKSFNAQNGKLTTLDSTNATGTSNADAHYETYGGTAPYILGNFVEFNKTWYSYPGYINVPGQQNSLTIINPDGTGKKVVSAQDATKAYFGSVSQYDPQKLLVQVSQIDNSPSLYYTLDSNGNYTATTDSSVTEYNSVYKTYLLSPTGNHIFWSEPRDGKNTLFTADPNGANSKTVATLSDYDTYGWYSDNYLLVSKNTSELYIMPVSGGTPLKITDYHKPAQSYNGYGGGYGGR